MNFGGGGGGAESLHYSARRRVRGWGVTVKKIMSSKTCHAWSVKINQLKISL